MPSVQYVTAWARAFMLTCTVEACVLAVILPSVHSWSRRLGAAVFAQAVTHPAVWFIFPTLSLSLSQSLYLTAAETWAVGAEAIFYRFALAELGWARALGLSLLANGTSWGLGALLRSWGVPI